MRETGWENPLEGEQIGLENATSFEELYEIIRAHGPIQGTQEEYLPPEIIKTVEQVRHGHRSTNFITRSFGIRAIVERLITSDAVFQKYTKGSKAKKAGK